MTNTDKLTGVHPRLIAIVTKVIDAMEVLGFTLIVTDGARTAQQQAALYTQGRSTPGPNVRAGKPLGDTVTAADGIVKQSNHQLKSDGFGRAVDCAFLVNGHASWAETLPWNLYGEMAKALGARWGGDWSERKDRPHIELPL